MSDDWNVGDLAVCVDAKDVGPIHPLEVGRTYLVDVVARFHGVTALAVGGIVSRNGKPTGYHSNRFRKVKPDEHTDCEPEFIELLKRSKAPSPKERETRILEALFPSGEPK